MTETETQPLRASMSPVDIAAGIAKDAQENLDGLDVVSIGPMWLGDAEQIEVYAVVPKDAGKDFAANIVTLGTTESPFLAEINRTALILSLEKLFGRVHIFSDRLAFAKYCQKQWPSENVDRVVASIVRNRGLNYFPAQNS
jgi:hypothetical protein